jgi:hypothetical protein
MSLSSIDLSSISAPEGEASKEFDREVRYLHSFLREHGWAPLDCSRGNQKSEDPRSSPMQGVHPLVAGLIGPSERFFSLDILEKNKWASTTGDDEWCGYRQAQLEVPEVFQMKLGGSGNKPDFCSKAGLALGRVLEDGRDLLLGLGWYLSPTSPNRLSDLLDHRPLPSNSSSASQLRILNYHSGAVGLAEHVDRGLLTVVVFTDGACSLEVFDQLSNSWMRPPLGSSCLLLVGHTLEAATAGAYRACKHRVMPADTPRLSLAFQLRARPDAKLDSSFVPSGLARDTPVRTSISVAELMKQFEATHTSVVAREREGISEKPLAAKKPKTSTEASSSSAADNDTITLTVNYKSGGHTVLRIAMDTPMCSVWSHMATKLDVESCTLRFWTADDGKRVSETATPRTLGLVNSATIDCMLEQCGD